MNDDVIEGEAVETTAPGSALATRAAAQPVQTWTPTFVVPVDEMVARVSAKHDFFKRVMRADDHYGVIPGTGTKPALLKPGAELLLSSMGLYVEFEDADAPTIDYGDVTPPREGLIRYRRRCLVYRQMGAERVLIARAEGSCSSRENKYRWRTSGAACPACNQPLRMSKDKPEWFCWRKKGGCGATYPKEQFSFEKIANPDLADVENTILKMADKRAMVAATLIATGCSDIFTQDIDETIDERDERDERDTRPATRTDEVRDRLRERAEGAGVGTATALGKEIVELARGLGWDKAKYDAELTAAFGKPSMVGVPVSDLAAFRERLLSIKSAAAVAEPRPMHVAGDDQPPLVNPATDVKIKIQTRAALMALLGARGIKSHDDRMEFAYANGIVRGDNQPIASYNELYEKEAIYLCKQAEKIPLAAASA